MAAKLKAPAKQAHPIIHFVHQEMVRKKMTRGDLSYHSGVPRGTLLYWWRDERDPSLSGVASLLEALGYELSAKRSKRNG